MFIVAIFPHFSLKFLYVAAGHQLTCCISCFFFFFVFLYFPFYSFLGFSIHVSFGLDSEMVELQL